MQTDEPDGSKTQQAPFVCYVNGQAETESALTTFPSTADAVEEGFAIIDGSATKTLGSMHAVEALLRCNQERHGDARLAELDNPCLVSGTARRAASAPAKWGSQPVAKVDRCRYTTHTLNQGVGSILFSIDALRTLGAIR